MLILVRYTDETIEIDKKKVRLGITAPTNLLVYRKELAIHRPFTKTIPLCHCNGDEPLKGTNR